MATGVEVLGAGCSEGLEPRKLALEALDGACGLVGWWVGGLVGWWVGEVVR